VREAGRQPVRGAAEVEAFQQVAGPRLPVAQAAQRRGQRQVLPRRRARDEAADIGAVPDPLAYAARVAPRVDAADDDRAAGGRQYAGQRAQRRGLAGAVAADECDRGAGPYRQVQPVDRADVAELDGEPGDLGDCRTQL
jgi:hypothetical protein